MKTRASEIWSSIIEGFWFLPAVMALSAILFAAGTLWVDAEFDINWGSGRGLIYAGEVAGDTTEPV